MQLFYNESLHEKSTEFLFDKIESRHIIKVLRKKEGDLVYITNGKNLLFEGKITQENDKKCRVQIKKVTRQKSTRNYTVGIAIAPTKNNARYEWFLEKASEIGVDYVYPIICDHSERKIIKVDRMNKVLQTALKQSLQFKLPILNETITFKKLMKQVSSSKNSNNKKEKYIAVCDFEGNKNHHLFSHVKQGTDILLLIGPEGGFSPNEKALALDNSFIPVSLGTNRLRTETAGLVALHTVSLANNP